MVVGICKLTLRIAGAHSLKEKRAVLRKIKDRALSKFQVPIAEVESADSWQRAVLGFAIVSNERGNVEKRMQRVLSFIEDLQVALVTERKTDVLTYGTELDFEAHSGVGGGWKHWEPEE